MRILLLSRLSFAAIIGCFTCFSRWLNALNPALSSAPKVLVQRSSEIRPGAWRAACVRSNNSSSVKTAAVVTYKHHLCCYSPAQSASACCQAINRATVLVYSIAVTVTTALTWLCCPLLFKRANHRIIIRAHWTLRWPWLGLQPRVVERNNGRCHHFYPRNHCQHNGIVTKAIALYYHASGPNLRLFFFLHIDPQEQRVPDTDGGSAGWSPRTTKLPLPLPRST